MVDPKEFCENLTEDFLASKFSDSNYTGSDFLGSSGFASEGAKEEAKSIYQPGSFLHKAMLSLYKKDTSFRDFVDAEGIDIETGFTVKGDNEGVGDKLFRKLKPIVLMRDEFMKGSVKRTRKRVTLYSGKEAVFGMSEGNPRKLLGLLNDLFDLHSHKNDNYKNLGGPVAELTQARVLSSASARTVTALKSTPVYPDNPYRSVSFSLYKIVDLIGNYFHTRFYDSDFDLDPLGSFRVDEGLDPEVIHVLSRLIDAGSIIPVSQSHGEIPSEIIGNRFRLSFMISPTYKLAFRNYGEMSLASILGKQEFGNQLSLFEE